jgi:hypothetical protein
VPSILTMRSQSLSPLCGSERVSPSWSSQDRSPFSQPLAQEFFFLGSLTPTDTLANRVTTRPDAAKRAAKGDHRASHAASHAIVEARALGSTGRGVKGVSDPLGGITQPP